MSTTATVVLVGGVGLAVILYMRSQQQQGAALSAGAAAAAAGGAAPRPAGGVTGFANGLWTQWKGDPLGIQNAKAVAGVATNVVKTSFSQASSLVHGVVGGIRSIF